MKINRQPLAELSEDVLRKDREYWSRAVEPLLGDWLAEGTPLRTVADFAAKVSMPIVTGDPRDPQSDSAQRWASKLRSSIAGMYAWRMDHAADESAKARMAREADFAFRQAFAICPYSPEAVYRYVNFLVGQHRISDALLVGETAARVNSGNSQLRDLIQALKKMQATQ
jgi:hypothetical protein